MYSRLRNMKSEPSTQTYISKVSPSFAPDFACSCKALGEIEQMCKATMLRCFTISNILTLTYNKS